MSASVRSQLPAFGVSRNRSRKGNDEQSHSDIIKIPIIDIRGNPPGQAGDFCLNAGDGLLHYHNSQQWLPLAVHGGQRAEANRLAAADNSVGVGENVYISSGRGGIADGEIHFELGGEPALTIEKGGGVAIKSGDLHLENPAASIRCHIARAEVTAVRVHPLLDGDDNEETVSLPAVELDGMTSILTVNANVAANETVSGIINNELIQQDSWFAMTIVNRGSGVPYVWLSELQDGSVQYNICCFGGELSCLELHLDVRN